MNDKVILSYVNIYKFNSMFNNTNFNFDNKYVFNISKDESGSYNSYILHVEKKSKILPDNFWGSNISNVNMIVGKMVQVKLHF